MALLERGPCEGEGALVIKASREVPVGDWIRGEWGHPAGAGRFKSMNSERNMVDAVALVKVEASVESRMRRWCLCWSRRWLRGYAPWGPASP